MNIKNLSEIEHEGDFVKLIFKVPLADFLKLVDSLKKVPKPDKKAEIAATVDLKEKKAKFSSMIKDFASKNPGLHPMGLYNQFYAYWTEPTKNGKKIRYEGETYFDIAKRLATFRRNISEAAMSKLWEEHNNKIKLDGATKSEETKQATGVN